MFTKLWRFVIKHTWCHLFHSQHRLVDDFCLLCDDWNKPTQKFKDYLQRRYG